VSYTEKLDLRVLIWKTLRLNIYYFVWVFSWFSSASRPDAVNSTSNESVISSAQYKLSNNYLLHR